MRGCGLGDDATHVGTTCEEDFIPAFGQQCLDFGHGTLDNGITRRVEGRLDDFLHDCGAVRSAFAGLDHHGVTGSNSANSRT